MNKQRVPVKKAKRKVGFNLPPRRKTIRKRGAGKVATKRQRKTARRSVHVKKTPSFAEKAQDKLHQIQNVALAGVPQALLAEEVKKATQKTARRTKTPAAAASQKKQVKSIQKKDGAAPAPEKRDPNKGGVVAPEKNTAPEKEAPKKRADVPLIACRKLFVQKFRHNCTLDARARPNFAIDARARPNFAVVIQCDHRIEILSENCHFGDAAADNRQWVWP